MIQPPTTVDHVPPALVVRDARGPVSAVLIAPTCWANCDGSTTQPIVNVNDFGCFQNAFAAAITENAAGEIHGGTLARADCNQDRVVNVQDFQCFQNAFAAGCPCYRVGGQASVVGGTVTASAPFVLRFEAGRSVTLLRDDGTSAWIQTVGICVALDSPGDWRPSMLPGPIVMDYRSPPPAPLTAPAPAPIDFDLSPKSHTGRKR